MNENSVPLLKPHLAMQVRSTVWMPSGMLAAGRGVAKVLLRKSIGSFSTDGTVNMKMGL